MCRFMAVCGNPSAVHQFLNGDAAETFQKRSRRHTAGWGVGWYEEGSPVVFRKPVWVRDERSFLPRLHSIASPLVFLHVRRATRGVVSLENTHPFALGKWIFAHNGTIVNRVTRQIREWLHPVTRGSTDSEVFFHLLLHFIHQERGDVIAGTRLAVRWVYQISTSARLNFILADGNTVYAYRRGHTLYRFAERLPGGLVEGVASDALKPGWSTIKRDWMFAFDGRPGADRMAPVPLFQADPQDVAGAPASP